MDDYNAYPNQPFIATIPQKQKTDEAVSIEETLAQVPLLKKTVKRLENRIDATDSVKEAFAVAEKYKVTTKNALIAMDIVREVLQDERNEILNKVSKIK